MTSTACSREDEHRESVHSAATALPSDHINFSESSEQEIKDITKFQVLKQGERQNVKKSSQNSKILTQVLCNY